MDQSWLQVPWENKDAKKVYSFQLWHGYLEVNSDPVLENATCSHPTHEYKEH